MFPTWTKWLSDLNHECDGECKALLAGKLRDRKKDLLTEINHLQYESHKFYTWYSQAELARAKAKLEYHKIDFQLATLDGRLTVVEEIRGELELERTAKQIIRELSPRERQQLLTQLREDS